MRAMGSDSSEAPEPPPVTSTPLDYRPRVRPMSRSLLAPPLPSHARRRRATQFAPEPRRHARAARGDRRAARRGVGRRRPGRDGADALARQAADPRAHRQRARPRQPVPRDQRARRLRLRLHDRRRHGGRHRRHRRRGVRDHGQRPLGARRRPHPVRGQEVVAGHRDRPRQPHAVRQLRGVGRRRPPRADRTAATAAPDDACRPTTSPRPAARSTT